MTTARSQLICHDVTPYYHCVSRCVRRSFLCGEDAYSGKSYEHRRDWVEQRILALATFYCIDIYAYAVMSNHYHLVAHIDKSSALALSPIEVIERWGSEHKIPDLIQRFIRGELLSEKELHRCHTTIESWRERLYSLSWFMRELNYDIAVQANKEDNCTGRFWEGRFKSQALLGEKALLCAMAYVDLNPIRSQIAETPEQSDYTSIKKRLTALTKNQASVDPLTPFTGEHSQNLPQGIPFLLMDYLEFLDWLGRQIYPDKPGFINRNQPPIIERLSLDYQDCMTLCTALEAKPRLWVGCREQLSHAKTHLNKKRITGLCIS